MKLRVYLPSLDQLRADTELRYQVLQQRRDSISVVHSGTALLSQLPRHDSCELILAAVDGLTIEAQLPKLKGARLRAALPSVIEEHWLGDIENAFVAVGTHSAQGTALVAIDKLLLKRALGVFAAAGQKVSAVTVASLALPFTAGQWTVSMDSTGAAARTGVVSGMALSGAQEELESQVAPVELQLALAKTPTKPNAIMVHVDPSINPPDTEQWSQTLGVPVHLAQTHAPAGKAGVMPIQFNVLQYEFAPNMADWRAWRAAMILVVLIALVGIVGLNLQARQLKNQASAVQDRMLETLTQTFPKIQTVVDPMLQMRQQVEQMRSGAGAQNNTDFLPMAAQLAQAVPDSDALRSLEYSNNALRARFAPTVLDTQSKKDALVQRMSATGLSARFEADQLVISRGKMP